MPFPIQMSSNEAKKLVIATVPTHLYLLKIEKSIHTPSDHTGTVMREGVYKLLETSSKLPEPNELKKKGT